MVDIEQLQQKIEPAVIHAGYEIVELRFQKEFGTDTLTLFIYKKGGVELSDCETVSSIVNPILDEIDFTDDGYNFNVSSPGLDRPIRSMDDYRRNMGEDVEIVYAKPIGKSKSTHGILVEYDEESFTLQLKNEKIVTYKKSDAAVVRPYINF